MIPLPLPSDRVLSLATLRELVLALVGGLLAYWVSCLLVPPGAAALGFGSQWQLMSEAPFELRGQLPHRLLVPFLAWTFGCGGDGYVVFVRGLNVVLLGTVFFFCRRAGVRAADALLVALGIALTAPVQMYKLHWVGYTDPICYTLLLWALLARRRAALFWLLFGLNLFNHEIAAFLVPWLLFVRRQVGGSWRADLIGLGAALSVYLAFYLYVKAHAAQQLFDADYFLQYPLFPGGTVAVWNLGLVHATVAYGPVLAVIAWHQHSPLHRADRWHLGLLLLGIAMIFCIAFDWQRHTNLIVPALVLSSLRFLQAGHRREFVAVLSLTVALLWWWPPWSPTAWPTHDLLVIPAFATGVVLTSPDGYGFGSLGAVFGAWIPAVWKALLPLHALLAGIWVAGWWWARRTRGQPAGDPRDLAPASRRG